jgi:hypothetical protein
VVDLHAVVEAGVAICSIGVPPGLAWLTALFGSERYSERAMRLLRRPSLQGTKKFN